MKRLYLVKCFAIYNNSEEYLTCDLTLQWIILICLIEHWITFYLILICVIISSIKLWCLWRKNILIIFFGQNWHTTKILVFNFSQNLIIVIFMKKKYVHVYAYSLYKIPIFLNFGFGFDWINCSWVFSIQFRQKFDRISINYVWCLVI